MNIAQAILGLYPNADPRFDFRVVVDENDAQHIEHWDEKKLGPQPDHAALEAAYAPAIEALRVTSLKDGARQVILARFPEWKQANMTARALELLDKKMSGALTTDEVTELNTLKAAWGWIKAVRAESNTAEVIGTAAAQVEWPK